LAKILIETKDLKREYKLGEITVQVLKGTNIQIRKGEFIAISGASGSGKSTLLNQIALLDTPTSGKIYIGGIETSKMSEKEKTNFRLKKIGFVFQFFNLIPELNVLENVMLPIQLAGVDDKTATEKAKRLLSLVDLEDRMENMPSQISGGQMQRVSIARGLANDPEILFADEPTGNLDSKTSKQVINLFKKINNEKRQTVVIVTHDRGIVKEVKRIVKLVDGKIIAGELFTPLFIEKKIAELLIIMSTSKEKLTSARTAHEDIVLIKNIERAAHEIRYLDLKEEAIVKEVEKRVSSTIKKAHGVLKRRGLSLLKEEEVLENRISVSCGYIINICEELLRDLHVQSHDKFQKTLRSKIKQISTQIKILQKTNIKEELVNEQVYKKLSGIIKKVHATSL